MSTCHDAFLLFVLCQSRTEADSGTKDYERIFSHTNKQITMATEAADSLPFPPCQFCQYFEQRPSAQNYLFLSFVSSQNQQVTSELEITTWIPRPICVVRQRTNSNKVFTNIVDSFFLSFNHLLERPQPSHSFQDAHDMFEFLAPMRV